MNQLSKPLCQQSWETFRNSGLLWFINRSLHLFGWTIVVDMDNDNQITNVYPARTSYRGFDLETEEIGFKTLSKHIAENHRMFQNEGDKLLDPDMNTNPLQPALSPPSTQKPSNDSTSPKTPPKTSAP